MIIHFRESLKKKIKLQSSDYHLAGRFLLFAFIIQESQRSRMNANQCNYPYTLRKILDFQSNSTDSGSAGSIQYGHE